MFPLTRYKELKEELKRVRSPLQCRLDTIRSEVIASRYRRHWQDEPGAREDAVVSVGILDRDTGMYIWDDVPS